MIRCTTDAAPFLFPPSFLAFFSPWQSVCIDVNTWCLISSVAVAGNSSTCSYVALKMIHSGNIRGFICGTPNQNIEVQLISVLSSSFLYTCNNNAPKTPYSNLSRSTQESPVLYTRKAGRYYLNTIRGTGDRAI